jgi:hypothetical protein
MACSGTALPLVVRGLQHKWSFSARVCPSSCWRPPSRIPILCLLLSTDPTLTFQVPNLVSLWLSVNRARPDPMWHVVTRCFFLRAQCLVCCLFRSSCCRLSATVHIWSHSLALNYYVSLTVTFVKCCLGFCCDDDLNPCKYVLCR